MVLNKVNNDQKKRSKGSNKGFGFIGWVILIIVGISILNILVQALLKL